MKKKWITITAVILVLLMLVPVPMAMNDGGTVVYKAVLYEVTAMHRISDIFDDGTVAYQDGWVVSVLGIEVYNSVE